MNDQKRLPPDYFYRGHSLSYVKVKINPEFSLDFSVRTERLKNCVNRIYQVLMVLVRNRKTNSIYKPCLNKMYQIALTVRKICNSGIHFKGVLESIGPKYTINNLASMCFRFDIFTSPPHPLSARKRAERGLLRL